MLSRRVRCEGCATRIPTPALPFWFLPLRESHSYEGTPAQKPHSVDTLTLDPSRKPAANRLKDIQEQRRMYPAYLETTATLDRLPCLPISKSQCRGILRL